MPQERHLSNAAVEYIETRVDRKLHPAFEDPTTEIKYNPTIDQFLDQKRLDEQQQRQQQELQASVQNGPAPIDEAEHRKNRFQEALDAYLTAAAAANEKKKKKTPSKLGGKTTWDDVLDMMRKAEDEYQDVGPIRTHLRKFSENAPVFNSWLTLLPQASYSSSIYGGIKIMFDAAAKLNDVREKVFDILGEIPDRIAKTQVYTELYRSSQRVQEKSMELYVAILDIFEHVLGWFAQKPGRKFAGAFGKGAVYSKGIDDKVVKMRAVAKDLREEAKLCLHESLRQVNEGSALQDSRLGNIELMAKDILRSSLNANYTAQIQSSLLTNIYNQVYQFLRSSSLYDDGTGKANIPQIETEACVRYAKRKVYSTELLESLEFSPDDLSSALQACLRHGHGASLADKDRANWVMKSEKMSSWLTSTASSTLLINGNGEHAKTSPLSFITALLAQSLTQSDIPVLHFFCGHSTGSGSDGGPGGMIRSLTAQLLTHYDFDLSFRHSRQAPAKLKHLCRLFENLITQLPDDALLFVLLDGVTYFENAERREETCFVVRRLHEIAYRADAVIKMLITAPGNSKHVMRVLDRKGEDQEAKADAGARAGKVLHVPTNPDGGRVGLNVPFWERRTSGSFTDLRKAVEDDDGRQGGRTREGGKRRKRRARSQG